jgi:3-hydroxyisobutyrate dehydrogenase-like beta-hydroxyacid dehydrogenase
LGSKVYHLGGPGSGAVMKLAVNGVIYALGQAVSESLVLAEQAGIERAAAYEVFENSAIAAPMVKYRHDAFVFPETTPTAFAMSLAAKDLGLIRALAEQVGVPVPQAVVNHEVLKEAIAAGLGDHDMAAVAVHLRTSVAIPRRVG